MSIFIGLKFQYCGKSLFIQASRVTHVPNTDKTENSHAMIPSMQKMKNIVSPRNKPRRSLVHLVRRHNGHCIWFMDRTHQSEESIVRLLELGIWVPGTVVGGRVLRRPSLGHIELHCKPMVDRRSIQDDAPCGRISAQSPHHRL